MIDIIVPNERHSFSAPLLQMYHDRKRVFVDQLGWRLRAPGSWLEVDEYDNEHAVYLMARDAESGDHLGSVRLLPTTGAHMMAGIFPDLCMDGPIVSPNVWEISRLVATVSGGKMGMRLLRVHRMLAIALVEFAVLNDITSYVLVAESQRVPALLSVGWAVIPLSLPTPSEDGEPIEALKIIIDEETLPRMRKRLGFDAAVLAGPTDFARAA